jgi:phosphoserine aminotransferase
MTQRIHNFNAGPAALPLEVLHHAQEEFVEFQNGGMSIMEMSHRSKRVEEMHHETQRLLLEALQLKKGYQVLFMGGGASTQFALLPLNFLQKNKYAAYALSGSFSEKAYQEAQFIGDVRIIGSSKAENWSRIPQLDQAGLVANCSYLHITSNNTIEGSRYNQFPEIGQIPLIADMTSDILSRKLDLEQFSLIYAGAQKNLGPAGVTAVIIREDLLQNASQHIPLIFRYETYAKHNSLYNTPPVHSIYMMNLVLKWVIKHGGIEGMEQQNKQKAKLIYDVIDSSAGFYKGIIAEGYRSDMNITWRMSSVEMEQRFVKESEAQGFEGLAGHRSVDGLRASAYNAVSLESCKALADFMIDFKKVSG